MNRRRILIALAVFVPLALFGAAKNAASWRPVKLGALPSVGAASPLPLVMASSNAVIVAGDSSGTTWFDLPTQRARARRSNEGFTKDGANTWEVTGSPPQLELLQNTGRVAYPLPATAVRQIGVFGAGSARAEQQVEQREGRVELLTWDRYCRWNAGSRELERDIGWGGGSLWADAAATRDGENIVAIGGGRIAFFSTRDERATRRVPVATPPGETYQPTQVSPYGSYAIYETAKTGALVRRADVLNCATGGRVWSFQKTSGTGDATVISPDEIWLAQANSARRIWEIYDLKSGALQRTLPQVSNARTAAFSPDGNTLYSVADGVLYRQRAR